MSDSFDHFLRTFMRLALDRSAPKGTKTALADRAGVSQATISKWTSGSVTPDVHQWPAIEAHFFLPAGTFNQVYSSLVGEAVAAPIEQSPSRMPKVEEDINEQLRAAKALRQASVATKAVLSRHGEIFDVLIPDVGTSP